MDRLIETREAFPDAGLVGSKLVFPNGRLQEAGSVVWRDGSALNYGYGEDPSDPRYAFARRVDYVSAASVLIGADLFEELGGFDECYAPAFYEDTDLAFRVRQVGKDVVYQPASTVIHFGGATHGIDTDAPLKRYQVLNAETFFRRWENRLGDHFDSQADVGRAALRLNGPRALVIDAAMLTPDQDSGSLRMYNLLGVLGDIGYAVTFMPCSLENTKNYADFLRRNGIQVSCSPHTESIERFLEIHGAEFEFCIISRPDSADRCLDAVKTLCPNALVLYDTVDLHYLRRERELELTGISASSGSIREKELRAVKGADAAITVSDFDRRKLLEEAPNTPVHVVSNIHEIHENTAGFLERSGILFIGGFQHPPNADAVLWFLAEVFPALQQRIPGLCFHVIGSDPPKEIREQASENIIIEGFLEDVQTQFESRRLSIAPLRYGSGVKGKINQSMAYALPCVATTPAVEGMGLDWGREILVADSAQEFAGAVAELYENEDLWHTISSNSAASIERSFSKTIAEESIRKILDHHGRKAPNRKR
jgi:hypothetical protein